MIPFIKKYYILVILVVLIIAVSGMFDYLQYRDNSATSKKISSLENQVAALGSALQSSNVISQAAKTQLQETNNRSNVIANSQDISLTSAVAKAAPAVVSVVVSKDVPLLQVQYVNPFGNDPNFRDAGIQVPVFKQVGTKQQEVGAGTGFLVRSDGYIVTNQHVVSDNQAEYTVLLSSGDKKTASVIYRDTAHDIAIIKIDGSGYPTLSLGDSSALELGQTVAAIGNALGEYNNSVSVGIIAGLNRTIEAQDDQGNVETLSGIIQTDAAINRGNSGGPLLDLSGNVVGINVAMDQGGNNIAFAIPANEIKSVINSNLP